MQKNIDDIMIQDHISESEFRSNLKRWIPLKTLMAFLLIITPIITVFVCFAFLDLEAELTKLICIGLATIEVLILLKSIKAIQKKLGRSFKTHIVKPIIQKKYQTTLYLQDDIPLERIKYANVAGNSIKYSGVEGNDYFQGISLDGRRFEFADCSLIFNILGHSQVVFTGQILMVQMNKVYRDDPVVLMKLPFSTTHKDYKKLSCWNNKAFKKYFRILKIQKPVTNGRFFTEENVGFTTPSQTNPTNLLYPETASSQTEQTENSNTLTLNTLLTDDYVQKLIFTAQKFKKEETQIFISIHGDMFSIALTNNKDLLDAHPEDRTQPIEYIQARVEEELKMIDELIELVP